MICPRSRLFAMSALTLVSVAVSGCVDLADL